MMKSPHEILGISPNATPDEAKQAYRRLARKYHPDVSKEPNAEERFKEVQQAYEAFKNPQKHAHQQRTTAEDVWAEVFRNFGDFGFAGTHRHQTRTVATQISLENAYTGASVDVYGHSLHVHPGCREGTKYPLSGDTVVVVHVAPHPRFKRNNDDLLLNVQLTMSQAILGCEVKVRHLNGKTYSAKVPGGIQNGQTIRMRGLGMPSPTFQKHFGDLFLQVFVSVPQPSELTDEQRDAIMNLDYRETINA